MLRPRELQCQCVIGDEYPRVHVRDVEDVADVHPGEIDAIERVR
jgi:hypothetical protein